MSNKLPISALPLPKPSHLLTHNLTPDSHTPTVAEFRGRVLPTTPSIQRRARLLSPQSHFSYVLPLPLPFPYEIEAPPEEPVSKADYVEQWLAAREAVHPKDSSSNSDKSTLELYYPKNRDQPRVLIGLAETGLGDCLPQLDVGDAFETLGVPALLPLPEDEKPLRDVAEDAAIKRQEVVDVLSGHAVLMSPEQSDVPFAPWSLRYSGHQFGVWAGQLGDGRAISILTTPHPSDPDLTYELQLKGAGRTPFSRSADGLAVLRSSVREFLCSEAMQALSIPTTRSLSLISLPSLPVARERLEYGCILTRVAPSFLRIGSFEALNGPPSKWFFGGGGQEAHWDALRVLGEWVVKRVLRLDIGDRKAWGRELVLEVARRNARMVAAWQAYGFMHGVINTDNVSILGLTIDYGPYAFMDVFDPHHICNHTDEEGRYAYMASYQPTMIIYALRSLLNSLAPLIGAERKLGGRAVSPGWADNVSDEKLAQWRLNGLEAVKKEMEDLAQKECANEYGSLMRKRLGLRRREPTDESQLTGPLLKILQDHKLDFHSVFRLLSDFRPSVLASDELRDGFVTALLRLKPDPVSVDPDADKAETEWKEWLHVYAARIESEKDEWVGSDGADVDSARAKAMNAVNPRFVLRQWVLEEVIKHLEIDHESGKRVLGKVLKMACNPFEPWGAQGDERPSFELQGEIREERRYCGYGPKSMLGLQCSCSS